jgi:hypothetical protein
MRRPASRSVKPADAKQASRPSFQISTETPPARPSSTIADNILFIRFT